MEGEGGEAEGSPAPAGGGGGGGENELQGRIRELQEKEEKMEEEKKKMEEDFGLRRAKLKELYLQKEKELQAQAEQKATMDTELEVLRSQVQQLQADLEEAHSAVTIAHCTAENDVAVEQRKCQEEIATVHQLMKEEVTNTGERYEGEIKRLKKLTEKLDAEKQHYRRLYERQLEESDNRTKGDSLLSPGVLSAVTKSLAKRVPSLSPSTLSTPEKASQNASLGTPLLPSSAAPLDSENLEDSMKKAQEDADLLRSLVEPLEEEIHALKEKIRAQDAQLRAHEAQQAASLHTADLVAPLLQGTDAAQVVQQLDEKLKGMSSTLEAEKASRADLELYTAILNTQKTALTDDVDRLRSQLADLRQTYEMERRQHRDLKHTWQRANDQFLEEQRLQLVDMRCMREMLTQEQLQKLEEAKQGEEASRVPQVMLASARAVQQSPPSQLATPPTAKKRVPSPSLENDVEEDRPSTLPDLEEEPAELSLTSTTTTTTTTNSASSTTSTTTSTASSTTTASTTVTSQGEQSDDQSSETESHSLPPDSLVPNSMLAERFSPDKMPRLTQDQQKALSDMFPEVPSERPLSPQDDYLVIDFSAGADSVGVQAQGRRVVSEMEWNMLNEEIRQARSRLGRSCQLCASFQSQLQKAQSDHRETEKQRSDMDRALQRYKDNLDREAQYRQVMEERWQSMAEDYEKKVAGLASVVEGAAGKQSELETKFRSTMSNVHDKLRSLTERREFAQQELTRLQKENDDLVGKHSKHSQQLQNEIINLPDNMEEMQLLLLRYREDIIAAKVSKEHQEESLKSEILLFKDQVLMEQHEKNTIEDRLSSEIDQLREKVAMLESVESQMKLERRTRVESDAQVRDLEAKQAESQVKSKQIIAGLQTQLAEQSQIRARLEGEVGELKGRVSSLQHDLDNSEEVQRDFVRLSQSLQVQLEKIRQSEKEVRWQHEEDQEECNSCKQRFSAMGRRKHHCRHCGKIFCNECVSKTVPSGPHLRPSRVCDVCHTLLVQDATPYFSTEPPNGP